MYNISSVLYTFSLHTEDRTSVNNENIKEALDVMLEASSDKYRTFSDIATHGTRPPDFNSVFSADFYITVPAVVHRSYDSDIRPYL